MDQEETSQYVAVPEEINQKKESGVLSSVFTIFASIVKTIGVLVVTILKFFIKLPIGGKIIVILLLVFAVLISYAIGYQEGALDKDRYYEIELGLNKESIEKLKPFIKELKDNE